MKTINRMAALAVMVLISISAMAQPELYKKYSSVKGITKVYISPAIMQLVGVVTVAETLGEETVNLGAIASKINSLYLISTEDTKVAEKIGNDFEKMISQKKVELLMEVSDDSDNVLIYSESNNNVINGLYIRVDEEGESTVIMMTGSFTMKDIENIVKQEK